MMKNTCLTEEQIELLSLNEWTDQPVDAALKAHIEGCPGCRRVYVRYREIHENIISRLKESLPRSSSLSVRESLPRAEETLHYREDLAPTDQDRETVYAVAADSDGERREGRVRFLGIFTSADEKYMVRALYHLENASLHLHLVTEEISDAAGIRLELQPSGLIGITSYSGHLILENVAPPAPDDLSVRISAPRAKLFSVLSEHMDGKPEDDWSIVLEDQHSARVELGFLAGSALDLDYLQISAGLNTVPSAPLEIALSQNRQVIEYRGLAGTRIPVGTRLETGPLCISIFTDKAG